MPDQKRNIKDNDKKPSRFRIELIDFASDDRRPEVVAYAVGPGYEIIHRDPVDGQGRFEIPDAALKKAKLVVLGPPAEKGEELKVQQLAQYRIDHFQDLIRTRGALEIARGRWLGWLQVTRCVNGKVRHCVLRPWVIRDLVLSAAFARTSLEGPALEASAELQSGALAELLTIPEFRLPIFPFRCEAVCDGLVEVYRRTCCCFPLVIDDPRIPEIIRRLEDLIPIPLPVPPWPLPDPPPWRELPFLKHGTLDSSLLNARRDLEAIRRLSKAERVEYISARPYLFCTCGGATKVGQGFLQPSGEFHICWNEPIRPILPHCHDEYAFVVKQVINGTTTVIYDGLSAGQWFKPGNPIDLVSYHPSAISCRHNEFPGEGAFVLLQDIGNTGSYLLKTPDATGWDRVASPGYNDGLSHPASSAADALGKWKDRNWGGVLPLRCHFSEPMKGVGARYYRVSVAASNSAGNPTGARTDLSDGLTWRKYEVSGASILVTHEVLGPLTVNGTHNLFKIPYDADADWQSGQYHAFLDTRRPEFSNGRYLVTLEVFDQNGKRLKPNSAPAADPGTAKAFTFRRWFQETGPTAEVAFGALTHMFWWDNRSAQGKIEDLRVNGVKNAEQCQFLSGSGGSQFSTGYRAYHHEGSFQLYHTLWWRRGLGGPIGYLTSFPPDFATVNPHNVGVPPAPPGQSDSASFSHMLTKPPGSHSKCTFALNLRVYVKTFDGTNRLSGLDRSDQASFALEIV